MRIEIAEPGRMTQSGSSLLKLIQNNKTPILDLLVRESIQNSLDAHKDDARSVTVEFRTGRFSSTRLCQELEGIGPAIDKRRGKTICDYLAICDSDTVGLTGEMDVQKVRDNNYGNLLKLVYEICKPQEAEGAGGSWGLGKTVYFRIGIGLVVYYSRIDEGNGRYSSRLAASLVENETKPGAMIPVYKDMPRRGIAWWGDTIRENTTIPVTDETYIRDFLDIFGITPYTGTKTGTAIIIPYINSELLLANNRVDYSDMDERYFSPFWYSSLEKYLRIAVQRWYAPRLCNPSYPFGAFLKAVVNGVGITYDSMEPVFKTVQALYNRANHVNNEDFLFENNADLGRGHADIKKYLEDTNVGNIVCTKLSREELCMNVPHNKPEPAVYFNCEITEKTTNRPLIFYVRKPGMIVSYETVSSWTAGIPSTNKNDYVFCIFVLNSHNSFKVTDTPVDALEEYVRKSEMADHTSWNDWSENQFNPRIISKIQKNIVRVVSDKFGKEEIIYQTKENSELSKYLGDLLLPPNGFGKAANVQAKGSTKKETKNQKKFSFAVNTSNIKYNADKMYVPMELKTTGNKKIKHTGFEIQIDSEAGKIRLDEWKNEMKLGIPFMIDNVSIFVDTIDGEKKGMKLNVSKSDPVVTFEDISFTLRIVDDEYACGLDITAAEEKSVRILFRADVQLEEKSVRPAFCIEKEGK